jgi:hypothetical protein
MSYGIWRRRGKGWCSIEIDSPGNSGCSVQDAQWDKSKMLTVTLLESGCDEYGVEFNGDRDFKQVQWELGQRKNQPQRSIVTYSNGEHQTMIAADNDEALTAALNKLEETPEQRNWVREQLSPVSKSWRRRGRF